MSSRISGQRVRASGENTFVDTPQLDKERPANELKVLKNKKLAKKEKEIVYVPRQKVEVAIVNLKCYRCDKIESAPATDFNQGESYQHVCKRCRRR